jgi:hypothetical protein
MRAAGICVTACVIAAGCLGDADDEPERCTDPRYGDGRCDTVTDCDAPDPDCFTVFPDQPAAQAFYTAHPAAKVKGPALPATDARFARMRDLLDRGWDGYRATHDLGDLAPTAPQLVLVDNAAFNAFVVNADRTAAFVVMVNRGLIDGTPDEDILGVVMHELQHILGMHVLPEVKERFVIHYGAIGDEPFGFQQTDDPIARAQIRAWLAWAEDAGRWHDAELAGLPLGDGSVRETFVAAINLRKQQAPAACAASAQQLASVEQMLLERASAIDGSIAVEGTNAKTVIDGAMTKLRNECFITVPDDFIAIHAAVQGLDPVAFRASLSPADRALAENKPFVDGVYAWMTDRRAKMRLAMTAYTQGTGAPWTTARYFSTEEAADNATVAVLEAMGLAPDAAAGAFLRFQPECRPLVDSGRVPPYGENLTDPHHATCWRAYNIRALAASGERYTTVSTVPRVTPEPDPEVRSLPRRAPPFVVLD